MQHLNMPEKSKKTSRRVLWLLLPLVLILAGVGGWYYYAAGRLQFEGSLQSGLMPLSATRGGTVSATGVIGMQVAKGQPLVEFVNPALLDELTRQRNKLQSLSYLLPDALETWAERLQLEVRRQDELATRSSLEEATDKEAQASILYSRASMLASQGKLKQSELDAAQNYRDGARMAVEQAREAFENASLTRANVEKELNTIRSFRQSSGDIPPAVAVREYENQKALVGRLSSQVGAMAVVAPADGTLVEVTVAPGDAVVPGTVCALFRPAAQGAEVNFVLPADKADKLLPGQKSRVKLEGADPLEVDGVVLGMSPGAANTQPAIARVALFPRAERPEERERLAAMPPGTAARVTVLLREPLAAPVQLEPSGFPASLSRETPAPVAPEQPAAPAPASLSVQSAFGEEPDGSAPRPDTSPAPPVLKSGSPEALGKSTQLVGAEAAEAAQAPAQGPPRLPPMKAPKQLTGSPLPDPKNNPSVVPQHVLDVGEEHTRP